MDDKDYVFIVLENSALLLLTNQCFKDVTEVFKEAHTTMPKLWEETVEGEDKAHQLEKIGNIMPLFSTLSALGQWSYEEIMEAKPRTQEHEA
jgi:hypothetical protein